VIVLVAAYAALILARNQKNNIPNYEAQQRAMSANADQEQTNKDIMSTRGWSEYQDERYPLQFKYPPTWDVSTDNSMPDYYAVELDTGSNGTVKIYVSKKDYLGMNGLETKTYNFNGVEGQVLGDWVYALKVGQHYYTFDSTETAMPPAELPTIVSTAKFN